ncbi:replication-relaxation family protein (plasmid) [Paenibacillus sonchi]|uniref:Replication-relaxation family protein n=1 Tax=Paenibacillus sonchi TaxID=373687 RepID=A0A974PJ37_9BACL|nr:replication-relaxation family protein [Paenibacillus sonchi]QQZ64640.1 replication-relaxation family protein [Paenibacillus sonchi]
MELHVSPINEANDPVLKSKPTWDDPYAFIDSFTPLTRHDYFYIETKIENGWITNRDIEIVRFLSVHRWLTLSQLTNLFFPGVDSAGTAIRNRVNKLQKYGLLRKIKWSSHTNIRENKPSLYEIGASGADILKYRLGVFLGSRDPRKQKEITMLFRQKYIATNEFYIQLRSSFNLNYFEFHPVLVNKEVQVVPTARFILSNPAGKQIPFFLFCYREEEKWLKTIRFQTNFIKSYLALEGNAATIVVLTSTDEKAQIANKIIDQEGLGGQTWFITDEELRNSMDGITKSFFVFQNGQKTYFDLG